MFHLDSYNIKKDKVFFTWGGGWGGGTWVNFCWACASGLSEPLPHYSQFCDQLYRLHLNHFWEIM